MYSYFFHYLQTFLFFFYTLSLFPNFIFGHSHQTCKVDDPRSISGIKNKINTIPVLLNGLTET